MKQRDTDGWERCPCGLPRLACWRCSGSVEESHKNATKAGAPEASQTGGPPPGPLAGPVAGDRAPGEGTGRGPENRPASSP